MYRYIAYNNDVLLIILLLLCAFTSDPRPLQGDCHTSCQGHRLSVMISVITSLAHKHFLRTNGVFTSIRREPTTYQLYVYNIDVGN